MSENIIPVDFPEEKKVFLGVCLNGFTAPAFIHCLCSAVTSIPFHGIALHPGGTSVFHARNEITHDFLKSDATHLFFWDSDIVASVEQIQRLFAHDVDVVGGIYPIKQDGALRVCVNDYHEPKPRGEDGLQSVRTVGTGFVLIRRCVIERMIEQHGERLRYQSDFPPHEQMHNFWGLEIWPDKERRRLLTEDWLFCMRWLEMGGEVLVDHNIFLRHFGNVMFPLLSQIEAAKKKSP